MNLLDLLYPVSCLECGKKGRYICLNCIHKVNRVKAICPECQKASIDGFTHAGCQKKYGIDGLFSIWSYEGIVRKAIIALKYRFATDISEELTDYITDTLKDKKFIFGDDTILIPIPLHRLRENFRGFNQSDILGKATALYFNWKYEPDFLVRIKHTVPQVELAADKRKKNIKQVFTINTNTYSGLLHLPFVIFDDVYTTGSTLKEAANILKRNGAAKVWGLSVAR